MRKRKIKFPLVLKDDVKVRTLEDMRLYFDLEKILAYFENGKLEVWLHDRYEDDIAERVSNIDKNSPDVIKLLCEALGTTSETNSDITMEKVRQKNDKLSRVRQITDEIEVINHYNQVAFSQKELDEILAEGEKTVYLYGDKFTILPDGKDLMYIGINTPQVDFAGHNYNEYMDHNIIFSHIDLDGIIPWGSFPKPGEEFLFGAYQGEPIIWTILDVSEKNKSALVISKFILDFMPYDKSNHSDWKGSSLCKWLNKDFFDSCFTTYEKEFIIAEGDSIAIPSLYELTIHSMPKESLITQPTECAKVNMPNYTNDLLASMKTSERSSNIYSMFLLVDQYAWWLRDEVGSKAGWVDRKGTKHTSGSTLYLKKNNLGVRPVMRVKL